jgi:hypothetical protein
MNKDYRIPKPLKSKNKHVAKREEVTKMKWSMIVILVFLCGCSIPYAHRPCNRATECYPECKKFRSMPERWDCITEIDLKEGRITEEQFKKYREQIHSSPDSGQFESD